jgi:hypothetical protein
VTKHVWQLFTDHHPFHFSCGLNLTCAVSREPSANPVGYSVRSLFGSGVWNEFNSPGQMTTNETASVDAGSGVWNEVEVWCLERALAEPRFPLGQDIV